MIFKANDQELLKKLARFSIFMSQDCWGSVTGYVLSMWLAEAILRGLTIQAISMEDIRFGKDQEIWNLLMVSDDPSIQNIMHMIQYPSYYHSLVSKEDASLFIVSKFRGIDPFVIVDGLRTRLTTTDPVLANEFYSAKKRMEKGWAIKINTCHVEYQSDRQVCK